MSQISLPRLMDALILPVSLVFGSKYIGVFIINLVLSFEWSFSFSASQVFSLPFVHYKSLDELLIANSLSSLIMILVLAVGFTWVFFRFQIFHENFILPKISARLHSKKMEYLIVGEVQAHNQITVWFTLAWLVFLLTLLEFLAGSVVLFVLVVSLTLTLFLSATTLYDMNKKALVKKG